MARLKIVAGNWKMNMNLSEGEALITAILNHQHNLSENQNIIIAPPFIHLATAANQLERYPQILLAAQNCHQKQTGAYTGEISPAMLKSVGVDYVILGHSERRQYFHEDAALLAEKTNAALSQGLKIIFCIGEPLEIREAEKQNEHITRQLSDSLFHLTEAQFSNIVIAYEPIWAIGTGRSATTEQAQEMHAHIRKTIAQKYGNEIADNLTILYGGSCKPENAAQLFEQPDVDGGLIGGASLKAADFSSIIEAL